MNAHTRIETPALKMSEFTGMQYLLMDIASNYAFDKEDWDVRLNWALEHEENLLKEVRRMRENPSYTSQYLVEADEPALMFAGMQALEAARQGKPTGYMISLDATASGMQLLSIMSGCTESARVCNVIPSSDTKDHREDAYTAIYEWMCQKVTNAFDVTRAAAKDSVMTALYGSRAVPKKHFGTGEMLEAFYSTLEERIPGAWNLNLALEELWQPYALDHSWVLPDNFHVIIKEMNPVPTQVMFLDQPMMVEITQNVGTKKGRSLCPNINHGLDAMVVREMQGRCNFDSDHIQGLRVALMSGKYGTRTTEQSDELVQEIWAHYEACGFLSTRILNLLCKENLGLVDADVIAQMIFTLPSKPFEIVTIHDCFRCLPNYGNDMRRQYNQILSDLAKSDILSYLATQITGSYVPVIKGADLSQMILSSSYAIC